MKKILPLIFIFGLSIGQLFAQQKDTIAMRLANPLGYITLPFQNNFDFNIPPTNGFRYTLNLMPVFPFHLGEKLNIINRVVLPVISQTHIYGNTNQTGLGDLLINTFLSPKNGELIWGIGPSFYFPSGFPEELSAKKWAVGPGVIAVRQTRKWMIGAMLFHIWTFAGSKTRPDFSYSYFQPLAVYTMKSGWGVGLTSEIGMEWKNNVINGAIILSGHKLVNINGQLISLALGPKLYFGNFNRPAYGIRATLNLLFP
ncbi:MAG: hypothetical protein AB9882_01575 [Ignavibacteriaceae bacterium]